MKSMWILPMGAAMVLVAGNAFAVQKYYISIGCSPDYKMHRIACDVGTSWKTCGRAACGTVLRTSDGRSSGHLNLAKPGVDTEPKLFGKAPEGESDRK